MAALEPGVPAPAFTLPDRLERGHSLAEGLAKGPVLLIFFKISCPTCQYALPFYERLAQRMAGAPLDLWAVSQNPLDQTIAFAREFGIATLPFLFDLEEQGYPVSNAYGITHVPTAFVIEPDGKIGLTMVGWSKEDTASIAQRLADAVGNPAVPVFEPGENVIAFRPG